MNNSNEKFYGFKTIITYQMNVVRKSLRPPVPNENTKLIYRTNNYPGKVF